MEAKIWSFPPAVAVVAYTLNSAKYMDIQLGLAKQIDQELVKLKAKYQLKSLINTLIDKNVDNKKEYYRYYYCSVN